MARGDGPNLGPDPFALINFPASGFDPGRGERGINAPGFVNPGPPRPQPPPAAAPPVDPFAGFHFPEIKFPDNSALFAQLASQREAQQREAERRAAFSEIDSILGQRTTAETESIRVVDERITQEIDRSRLLGLDLQVTDEQRLSRINNLFAELFPESSDSRLTSLMSQFGSPEMSTAQRQAIENGDLSFVPEFAITRGELTGQDRSGQIAEGGAVGGAVRDTKTSILDAPINEEPTNVLGL